MGDNGGFDKQQTRDPKAATASGAATPPLTGGLYVGDDPAQEPTGDVFYRYLRFTDPDRVTAVTSSGVVHEVVRWLGPAHKHCSQGVYELDGDAITFSATSTTGTVLYSGTVGPGALSLHLDSRSLINGHREHTTYRFQEADFPR